MNDLTDFEPAKALNEAEIDPAFAERMQAAASAAPVKSMSFDEAIEWLFTL